MARALHIIKEGPELWRDQVLACGFRGEHSRTGSESVCVCGGGGVVSEERPSHFITCYTANWDIKSAGAPRKRGAPSSSQDALWTTDSGLYVCPDPSSATRDVLAP